MAYVDNNTPVIEKITLPSGNTYFIADREIRDVVDALSQTVAGGVSYNVAWDGTSEPVVGNIPEGVTVTYNGTTYTGTMDANNATPGAFYLIKSSTQIDGKDVYNEYVPVGADGNKTWEKIGDTQIDLSDIVTDVELTKQTDSVIGADSTFTITQPTVGLETGATAGNGVISVATGINQVTDPTVVLSEESATAEGRVAYTKSVSTTKLSAGASGGSAGWGGKDQKTVLTGVQVTTQPTITLTGNNTTSTGRIQYVESQGSATTTKLSATADVSGKTSSAASSVTPTTKKLATTTVTGVSGSTTPSVVKTRSSQTTADGTWTAVASNTTNANNNLLANVSVTNGVLTIGAATLDTQTTYSAGAPSSITVPTAASEATTVATGATTTSGAGADIVTDVEVGDTVTVVTSAPTVTIANGDTGDVTVATGIGAGTTKYLSASAKDTAVGANGTANVVGANATISYTEPNITVATGTTGDVTVATGGTTKYMAASASGTAVTPTTTNVKAIATGGKTEWNNKDAVTVLKSTTDVDVTKGTV